MSHHGLLIIDKPEGITSRDAVDRALRWFPRRTRMGHTGTLDPLATGVLVLCIGHATRLTEYVQNMSKTYRSRFLLGARSTTDDADGTVEALTEVLPPTRLQIEEALKGFLGEIEQVPPNFSAAKQAGARAYDLARAGKPVSLKPRKVHIDSIDVLDYEFPSLEVEVRCGKGTYIRSLARDLGERLGCGGLVATLRRTWVGPFSAEEGISLDVEAAEAHTRILPLAKAVSQMPGTVISEVEAVTLRHGQSIGPIAALTLLEGEEVAALTVDGTLIAITFVQRDHRLRPVKVMPT